MFYSGLSTRPYIVRIKEIENSSKKPKKRFKEYYKFTLSTGETYLSVLIGRDAEAKGAKLHGTGYCGVCNANKVFITYAYHGTTNCLTCHNTLGDNDSRQHATILQLRKKPDGTE